MVYYAVRKGKIPGVYTTWIDCLNQVNKFSGAEFKKFPTEEEAIAFINIQDTQIHYNESHKINYPYSFIDGSCNPSTGDAGYGGFIMISKEEEIKISGIVECSSAKIMRNVSGEILGARKVVEKAIELGLKSIDLYYDYYGIEKWATGEWQRNHEFTRDYYKFMNESMKYISVTFIKVSSHTGVEGNEKADKLAKEAVGL